MKNNLIKNVFINVTAGVLAFGACRYFNLSTAMVFGLLATGGIGFIALHDYTPRRQVKVTATAARPVARIAAPRRHAASRRNALVAA